MAIESLTIKRHATPQGCFGLFIGPKGTPFAVTLELPWRNNQKQVSAIPPGTYTCKRVQSPKFGNTFEVTGVPGRASILFHGGNTTADSRGCILVGHGFDPVNGLPGIVQSKKEFTEFLMLTNGIDEFTLHLLDI